MNLFVSGVVISISHELAIRVDGDGTELNLMAIEISYFLPSEIAYISDERFRMGSHQILDLMGQNGNMVVDQTS